MTDEQKNNSNRLASASESQEDVYVEYMEDRKLGTVTEDEISEDMYTVFEQKTNEAKSNCEKEKPKPRPRSKMRTKSYELALIESEDNASPSVENDYLPMDGANPSGDHSGKNDSPSSRKPVPAPRPKDLDKRLAYARERANSPMFKANNSPIMPKIKAPSPPAKPPQDIVDKYFPLKDSAKIIINEKVTVIQEETSSENGKERRISKIEERPRSSTWYDIPDEEAEDDKGELHKSPDEANATENYEEIDEQEKPRPVSAYFESEVQLPTKKKHTRSFLGGGILDTLRSLTGSTRSVRSPKESDSPMRHSSKFYSDPQFVKSALGEDPDVSNASIAPSPRTPNLTLQVPVPSPRCSISNSSEKSPTSPTPPIPPPRLSKSKGSFETGDSFDENPVFVNIPTSISSDAGLDIMARSPRIHKLESDNIPEDFAPGKPPEEKSNEQLEKEIPPTPMLHPVSESTRKSLKKKVHKPIPEKTHENEEFDSLDVFIPPIEHQRVSPRKYPKTPAPLVVTKEPVKQRKVPSFDDLDMVVHEDGGTTDEDESNSGYAEPVDVYANEPPKIERRISSDTTPPALPPRDRIHLKAKTVLLPPPEEESKKPEYSNSTNNFQISNENTYNYIDTTDSVCGDYIALDECITDFPSKHASFSRSQSSKSTDSSVCRTVDSAIPVTDSSENVDTEPPPLPTTSPPRELPPRSDLESSPEREEFTRKALPPLPNHSEQSESTESDNVSLDDFVPASVYIKQTNKSVETKHTLDDFVPSPSVAICSERSVTVENGTGSAETDLENFVQPECHESQTVNSIDCVIPVSNQTHSSSSSSSYSSDSDASFEETTSCDESDEDGNQSKLTHSGEITPVEHKSLLDSLIGDRASVATLTPNDTSASNSLDYIQSDSSDESSHGGIYETIGEASSQSSQSYLSDPVRLRKQKALSKDSSSVLSYTSSEGSSRPASWASFSSCDYTPHSSMYMNNLELPRPASGESGVSSDLSIMSDASGLSLADSTHESIDSGQCSDYLSEEEMERRKEEKRKRKLFFVAREIMTSEQTFVDVLKLLNEDFRRFIGKSSEAIRVPVVPPQTLKQILNHLPELQLFSEGLLSDLKQRVDNWDKDPRIADIFVKKGPFLKLYTTYIMEYDSMCGVFDEARKKHYEFDRCTSIFEASTQCSKLTLRHFMLKPVQRIPQYRLLLKDYQKYLTAGSPEHEDTQVALRIVTEVAEHANQSMKYGENLSKLLEIQNKIVGRYEIIKPGRHLIKEGMLSKVSRKETQPRMFFLMNDVLLYTAPYTYSTYQLKNALPLVGMRVRLGEDEDEELKNEFSIISTQRSFTVTAETSEDKDAWVSALREAIHENNDKRRTFQPNTKLGDPVVSGRAQSMKFKLGAQHPVWIPDSRVSMCMLCSAEFTLIFRRHHCRACGQVVCSFCSDYQAPLRYLQNKPSRVCKTCYNKLKREVRSSSSSGAAGVATEEGEDSSLGLLSLFSKSAHTLRKSAHKKFQRVTNLRDSFGVGVKKKSKALKEASATDRKTAMSGYLKCWKDRKWVKHWYTVKGNVLFMFKGSEDTAATGSTVLLGYEVRPFNFTFQGVEPRQLFELIHQGLPSLMFRTDSHNTRDKWMKAIRVATVPL